MRLFHTHQMFRRNATYKEVFEIPSATDGFIDSGIFFQQCAFATQAHKPYSHAVEMSPMMERLALKVLQELESSSEYECAALYVAAR